jgi:hypothetical protein
MSEGEDGGDVDLESLREQTETGNRLQEDAAAADAGDADAFRQALIAALAERQEAGSQRTVSFWDGELAGLLDALESDPERLRAVGVALQEALGRDPNPEAIDRSEVVQLATRLGFQEATPEVVESWREAVGDAAKRL